MRASLLSDIRRLAAVAFLLALFIGPTSVLGEGAQPSQDLDLVQKQLDASLSRQAEISAELDEIGREEAALAQKAIELGETIQSRESAITSGEDRLRVLEGEAVQLRSDLAGRRAAIAKLLAGLQLIERNPPPALVVAPQDVLAALRGAMMFGSVVPELKGEAEKLTRELARLDELKTRTAGEQTKLKENLAKLTAARSELIALQARKTALLAETGDRLKAEKLRTRALAAKAKDLKELLASLERDRLKAEAEAKAEAEVKAEKEAAESKLKLELDAKAKAEADAAARRAAERAKQPHIAFAEAQGSLHYPAQGRIIKVFGADDGFGGRTRGVFVTTRAEAQVVSPVDGHVEFAGPFRSYGELLILNAGDGYHVLLAGLGEITAEQGQFVRAGEPVGTMGITPAPGTVASDQGQDGKPVLYIEFRKNGEAIDSSPWWVGGFAQARG
jgi:murein hydrolase activator